MTTLYGISNCDTVKKAKKWLDANQIEYTFHDFRKSGLPEQKLNQWVQQIGWEALLNKRSTTYRNLNAEGKESLNETVATTEMLKEPTLIKRPVLELKTNLLVGFKESSYQTALLT